MISQTQTPGKSEFALKPLSKSGIDAALEKAEQYRLLNQPRFAESICLDILDVEPHHQAASVVLLLALTDQFGQSSKTAKQAKDIANSLNDEYDRLYYTGIIHERQGSASLSTRSHGSDFDAYEWYTEAMEYYEKADAVNPNAKNEDPILRWNTCVRIITENHLRKRPLDDLLPALE
ncbi:MAG TPA: hypothetical protein VK666_28210 [Chryseolinea sp.]|nr:hypothetical protein [Chryseolinea sp.]